MSNQVKEVRTDEVRLIKEDMPEVNIRYVGRSDDITASDSDPVWQILREQKLSGVTTIQYALKGSFKAKWSDRHTGYFAADIPDSSQPLSGTQTVTGSIAFSPSGLRRAGRVSEVVLNAVTWTALPAVAFTDRNGLSIQNQSAIEIKLAYDPMTAGYIGPKVAPDSERFYDIKDTIVIYGKSASGTPTILLEEIS